MEFFEGKLVEERLDSEIFSERSDKETLSSILSEEFPWWLEKFSGKLSLQCSSWVIILSSSGESVMPLWKGVWYFLLLIDVIDERDTWETKDAHLLESLCGYILAVPWKLSVAFVGDVNDELQLSWNWLTFKMLFVGSNFSDTLKDTRDLLILSLWLSSVVVLVNTWCSSSVRKWRELPRLISISSNVSSSSCLR